MKILKIILAIIVGVVLLTGLISLFEAAIIFLLTKLVGLDVSFGIIFIILFIFNFIIKSGGSNHER